METNLAYYRRRLAEERSAELSASHPAVAAAHRELARAYLERMAALEAHTLHPELHLVSAA